MAAHTSKEPASDPVTENIETILRLEADTLQRRGWADKAADAIADFAGTIGFVALHAACLGGWLAINTGMIPAIPPFDPYPFALFGMIAAIEAVLLSAFVLIKQNRLGYVAERRAHLDLQINLLAEREVTQLLHVTDRIAERLGVTARSNDPATADMTEVEDVVETLDRKLGEAANATTGDKDHAA